MFAAVCAISRNQLDYESQELTWSIAVTSRTILRCRMRNTALFAEQSGKYLGIGAGVPSLSCEVSVIVFFRWLVEYVAARKL